MEKQINTPKMIQKRRLMLMLPLLALPFITFLFWSLGGGSALQAETGPAKKSGFNLQLPDANLAEDEHMDKMTYYEQAKKDSDKFQELIKNDLNYKTAPALEEADSDVWNKPRKAAASPKGLNQSVYNGSSNDPATEKIYSKLAELDKELNKPVEETAEPESNDYSYADSSMVESEDVQKLEAMMAAMSQPGSEDPELQQLNAMLEKILDIQHPDRAEQKIKQFSEENKGQVYIVTGVPKPDSITLLQNTSSYTNPLMVTSAHPANGFYSLNDEGGSATETQNAIQAVIHETQTLVEGSVVKLRLTNDIYINGLPISKNNFVFGIASLTGERLSIKINSIRYNNSLFPVELAVYDMDGLDGIYIPGAITRDVSKQSADRSMQGIGLTTLDPSWGAQAASAGIEAAKTLFSKKVKLIKVTVKAGYQVLLYDEKQKQNQ